MKLHVIPTGRTWVDPGGPFGLVPKVLWHRHQQTDDRGLLAMDMNCLLIESEGKRILVDNGLGDKLSQKAIGNWNLEYPHGNLIENLAKINVAPEDINIVLDTHLHSDHCGGNTFLEGDRALPRFPNAEYWVQQTEWADAMNPNARTRGTYLPENFQPVWETGQFRFLNGDTRVTKDVKCVVTPGHTRGHQCILIDGPSRPMLYVSDLASFGVHFQRSAWVTAYDVEPLETIRTKEKWQTWALEEQAILIFEHDPKFIGAEVSQNEEGRLSLIPAKL